MYVFAHSMVMEHSVAQDIVQEVWIDYWKRRAKIEPQYIKPYLFKAIRNKVFKHFRDTNFNEVQLDVLQSVGQLPEIEGYFEAEDLSKTISGIIQALPARCREIFNLSRREGLDNDEIALQLGISKRSVENQLSLALKKIKEHYNSS